MKKNKKKNKEKQPTKQEHINLCHRIWEGSVGICIQPQQKNEGGYFWKYTLTRCYKTQQTDEWRYDQFFSRNNDEALAVVLSKGMQFMDDTDPTSYVENIYEQHVKENYQEDVPIAA